ncbi:patatin-like phospholipase family protein [Rhodobacteraceae bacterium CCMM004]|nr:patatin-like phospholipase family protein [Rhodobacteraceae bacterium CCMM004]
MPFRIAAAVALAALTACSAVNPALNVPVARAQNAPLVDADGAGDESLWIGLAFSGGGMRASAFAHGVLEALRDATAGPDDPDGLLSEVRLVTGVSGGSVTAAHFGLHGPAGVAGFRDRYLLTDAERYMANGPFNPFTIVRGLSGGANDQTTFARYLDETLFGGATFGDLAARSRVRTWINASDVANNVPFLFSPETFDALCSDLSRYPLSAAVAASAAFPLVFSPIVLETHSCRYAEPDWLTAARNNPEATAALRAHAQALDSYTDREKVKFVKLLDGGITDNFGTTGLSVARARAPDGPAPLTPRQAVRLERLLFLVANAQVARNYAWTQKPAGPGGRGTGHVHRAVLHGGGQPHGIRRDAPATGGSGARSHRLSLRPASVRGSAAPRQPRRLGLPRHQAFRRRGRVRPAAAGPARRARRDPHAAGARPRAGGPGDPGGADGDPGDARVQRFSQGRGGRGGGAFGCAPHRAGAQLMTSAVTGGLAACLVRCETLN